MQLQTAIQKPYKEAITYDSQDQMLQITAVLMAQPTNTDNTNQEIEANWSTLTNIDNWGNTQNQNTNITES